MADNIKTNIPTNQTAGNSVVNPVVNNVSSTLDKVEETKVEKKDTVEVGKDVLEKLLGRVDKLEEDNKVLREVADKNRLGRVEELRAQGKLVKSVNLNTYNDKIVIASITVKNDTFVDTKGIIHEDQVVKLFFLDSEETVEMNYRDFGRLMVKIPVEVIEESKDKEGHTNFTVMTKEGRQIKIDSRYVN